MIPEKIDIPPGTPTVTGELYKPTGTAKTGLVVLAYGTEGYVDNVHGPWKTMMRGYAEESEGGFHRTSWFAMKATVKETVAFCRFRSVF